MLRLCWSLCLILPLAACGGGSSTPSTTPTPRSTHTEPPVTLPYVVPASATTNNIAVEILSVSPAGVVEGDACDTTTPVNQAVLDVSSGTAQTSTNRISYGGSSSVCSPYSTISGFQLQLPAGVFTSPVLTFKSNVSQKSTSVTLTGLQGTSIPASFTPNKITAPVLEITRTTNPSEHLLPNSIWFLYTPAAEAIANGAAITSSSAYLSGYQEGYLSLSSTQNTVASFYLYSPQTKLIVPNASSYAASFIYGYAAATGGKYPASIYVVDEAFWNNDLNPTAQEEQDMATSLDQLVAVWRYISPQSKLFAVVQPGLILNPAVRQYAVPVLTKFDAVGFDPYMGYNSLLSLLYSDPVSSTVCGSGAGENASKYLTECLVQQLAPLNPNQQYALVYQAFTFQATTVNSAAYFENWQAMNETGSWLQSQNRLLYVVPYGYYLPSASSGAPTEPGIIDGKTFFTASLISQLIANLGK